METLIERIRREATPPCVGCEWEPDCAVEGWSCPVFFSYVHNGTSETDARDDPSPEVYRLDRVL